MFKRKMKILQSIGALCVLTSMVCASACSGGGNAAEEVTEPSAEPEHTLERVTETAPEDGLSLSALSNGETAQSVWQISMGEQTISVAVWVRDAVVISGETEQRSDGVCLYLSRASASWGYTPGVSSMIFAFPDGRVTSYQAVDGSTMQAKDLQAFVTVYSWAEQGEDVCGYKVEFEVPYASFGADKAGVALAPTLYNLSYPFFEATVRTYSLTEYGTDVANQNTWLVADEEGGLSLNEEPYPTGEFSYKSSVYGTENSYWDLSEGYLASDERYEDRKVTLTNSLGNGIYNILDFYKTNAREFYCEAVFQLTEDPVHYFDPAPKFGFRLFDDTSSGLYFYVDAQVSSFTGNIIGTSAGYAPVSNGTINWGGASAMNVGFSADEPIKLAVYRRDGIVKLIVNDEVIYTLNGTAQFSATASIMPEVFSFNLTMTLTDYRSTTDENDPMMILYRN